MDANSAMLINMFIMFLMGFMVWIFFLKNFLIAWIKVKNPMSKYNVLVEVQHPVQNYYAPGQIEKNFLYYKGKVTSDNPKGKRIVVLAEVEKIVGIQNIVTRKNGVMNIIVDDAKGCVIYRDGDSYKSISGYSAEAVDDLVTDAQNRPSLEEGMMTPRVFQMVVVFGLIILAVGLYFVYDNISGQLSVNDAHVKMVYDQGYAIVKTMNITVTPINVTG